VRSTAYHTAASPISTRTARTIIGSALAFVLGLAPRETRMLERIDLTETALGA
jgi:hypothetical protein